MKKPNKNLIIVTSVIILAIISIGMIGKSKLSKKTSVSIKDNVVNENNLIYINLDGFSYDTYEKANDNPETETKNINMLIKNGVLFANARTGIPSITDPMQQSIVSGAWPIDTGNCYRYYDFDKEEVVQYARDNKLENIAQAANRNNIKLLAINSWFFKEKGSNEDQDNLYIEATKDEGYKERFGILKRVLKGEEIEAYDKKIKYEVPPQFISIYADDIDDAGHNLSDKMLLDSGVDLNTRKKAYEKRIENLLGIDQEIGEVIAILKERNYYDDMTFVITTDHGMVDFGADTKEEASKDFAFSQMPDLLKTIEMIGKKHIDRNYKVEMVNDEGDKASLDSDVVITTVGLQAQIKFREQPSKEVLDDMVDSLKDKPYYGKHMYDEELRIRGVLPRFADILVSPKPPYHFSKDFERGFYAVNQHDSLDDKAQKIFTMISGPNVKNEEIYNGEIYNIQMAPTMARIMGFEGPKDATASAVDEVLIDKYKGPKLLVKNSEDGIIKIKEDSVNLEIETESKAQIFINKKDVGYADKNGKLTIKRDIKDELTRFVIESINDGKNTRRIVFVKRI